MVDGPPSGNGVLPAEDAISRGAGPATLWCGLCRLAGCTANIGLIVVMYLEYLWAAEWTEIPPHCETLSDRTRLTPLQIANCMHRFTFSDSMLRGNNLTTFAVIGSMVAIAFLTVERHRVKRLEQLLQVRLIALGDTATREMVAPVERSLLILRRYFVLIALAFPGVLLLVPFHLERPLMHYGSTGVVVVCMLGGVCTYMSMPLGLAAGLDTQLTHARTACSDELSRWARRHESLRPKCWGIVALHVALPVAAGLHQVVFIDATGRLFGAIEVFAILSYQIFVALLAFDDFSTDHRAPRALARVTEEAPKAKRMMKRLDPLLKNMATSALLGG